MHIILLLAMAVAAAPATPVGEAQALLRAGQTERARELLSRAIEAAPGDLSARFWRATAAARLSDWSAAADDLTCIVERKPQSAESWVRLAEALAHLGRRAQAEAALREAERDPNLRGAAAAVRRLLADPAPAPADEPAGPLLGFAASGARAAPRIAAGGERLYDYTFGAAPTDWEPLSGTWEITSRYACEPEWSFFGGQSRGLCAIWNKRRFTGDLAVEAYVAFKHGLPWANEQWFYQPSDLNLTLFAEDGDLSTGCSFIFSGDHGRATMIRCGDQTLAETTAPEFLLPQFSDSNPLYQVDEQGRAYGTFHRHWWRLEARRRAGRLVFLIGGKEALNVADPLPSRSGHVALWTVSSGMVIARCRLAYQQELTDDQPAVRTDRPVPLPSAG